MNNLFQGKAAVCWEVGLKPNIFVALKDFYFPNFLSLQRRTTDEEPRVPLN